MSPTLKQVKNEIFIFFSYYKHTFNLLSSGNTLNVQDIKLKQQEEKVYFPNQIERFCLQNRKSQGNKDCCKRRCVLKYLLKVLCIFD
jgi:hypothetical protein